MEPLHVIADGLINADPVEVERGTTRRLALHPNGSPGITNGPPTDTSQHELVYRDKMGIPVGVMGYTGCVITDFAVHREHRRRGIARELITFGRKYHGLAAIRGPFTFDGAALVRSLMGIKV